MGDKGHGSGHHPGAPGKDAAVDAALIAHQEGLEGAEEQHADEVAQVVQSAQQYQLCHPDGPAPVENPEHQVDRQPHRRHLQRPPVLPPHRLLEGLAGVVGHGVKAVGVLLHAPGGQAAFGIELGQHGARHRQPQQHKGNCHMLPGSKVQPLRLPQKQDGHQQKDGQPKGHRPQIFYGQLGGSWKCLHENTFFSLTFPAAPPEPS